MESVLTPRADRRRPTVGVMLDSVDEDYQRAIWAGLEAVAREADVNVVNFLGGDVWTAGARRRTSIFELMQPERLDGIIVAPCLAAKYLGTERLDEYCARFRPLPIVSFGFPLASMPSVVCEGSEGLRALVEHLHERHGRRRFLFLQGYAQNHDAVERERIFRETLAALGVEVDERLVLRADFRADMARDAVRRTLDQGLGFDAIVAANDEMAIAALECCEDAGISLPESVSVTGFDDVTAARRLALPLSTVRQPTREMAERAMRILLGMMRGERAAPVERFSTEVVLRRSCGCVSEAVLRAGEPFLRTEGATSPRDMSEAVLASLGRRNLSTALGEDGRECVEALVRTLAGEALGTGAPGTFVSTLDGWLRSPFGRALGDDAWEDLLTSLRTEATSRLPPGAAPETLLHQARVLAKETARQQQWRCNWLLARKTQTVQYVIENLIGSFDIPALLENMARELPRIGIRRCYLAVHASAERAYEDARLLLAFDEHGRKEVGEAIVYPARTLLPPGILGDDRYNITWQPLVFGDEEVGFIGLEYDPVEDISGLALGRQIRSALKASMMMQEIREKDRLLENVDRMRNEFIANVTHDFRSLVTIIMDSAWLGMQADEHRGVGETRELSGIVYEASLRLKVAIDRLLDLASMDEHGLVLRVRKVRPKRFLGDLAAFYRPVLAVSGIVLEDELPEGEVEDLYSDPDKVEQIMHNLISNAAKFVQPGKGRIRLALAEREGEVQIRVTDDGEGIPPERLETIFVRYNAQRKCPRRGGSGIGLAFVKELATYLKGSIAAASDGPGKGATFTLTLRRGKDVFEKVDPLEARDAEVAASEAAAVRNQFRQLLESSLRGKMAQKTKPARA
jgi:DNA-binding LacI/PurR family transcriptional regulator/signal transduction histidine kinase